MQSFCATAEVIHTQQDNSFFLGIGQYNQKGKPGHIYKSSEALLRSYIMANCDVGAVSVARLLESRTSRLDSIL